MRGLRRENGRVKKTLAVVASLAMIAAGGAWWMHSRRAASPTASAPAPVVALPLKWPPQVGALAGDGRLGARDGAGAQAQFDGPMGVAIDAQGRVIVADAYNDRIRAIAPDGTVTTLAGGAQPGDVDGAGAQARFDTPCGVLVDAHGRIVVADTRNDAPRAIDAAGNVTTLARAAPEAPAKSRR